MLQKRAREAGEEGNIVYKANEEAMSYDRIPALSIEFLNCGKFSEKDWLVIPLWHYEQLLDELEVNKNDKPKKKRIPF